MISKDKTSKKTINQKVVTQMKENYDAMPSLKWQYFGSEDGVLVNYPSVELGGSCSDYDNRFRPWYILAATPRPKHIVIVVDKSSSMNVEDCSTGKSRMYLAKEAVNTILDMLSPMDYVGLVYFNSMQYTPVVPGKMCFRSKLARAVPANIQDLKDYNKRVIAKGGTAYRWEKSIGGNRVKMGTE
jgi:hypothetical protein